MDTDTDRQTHASREFTKRSVYLTVVNAIMLTLTIGSLLICIVASEPAWLAGTAFFGLAYFNGWVVSNTRIVVTDQQIISYGAFGTVKAIDIDSITARDWNSITKVWIIKSPQGNISCFSWDRDLHAIILQAIENNTGERYGKELQVEKD